MLACCQHGRSVSLAFPSSLRSVHPHTVMLIISVGVRSPLKYVWMLRVRDRFYRGMLCIARTTVSQDNRLSHAGILLKRLYIIASILLHQWIATPSTFFFTNRYGDTPTGTSLTGASILNLHILNWILPRKWQCLYTSLHVTALVSK